MAFLYPLRSGQLIFAAVTASILFSLGCSPGEQIQTYTVPKEAKAVAVVDPANAKRGEPTDRMLAAILPAGGQAWFFKVVGPIAEVRQHENEINDFFTGLNLADDGRAHWKVPAGWKEEPGNGFREATIVIPGDKRLELTVNKASWPGTQEGMLANVNRWRGQLQLPDIGTKQLGDVTHEAKAGDRPITIVDMKGEFKSGGMSPPFANGTFGPRATGGRSKSLPAGHPPIDADSSLPTAHPPMDDSPSLPAGHPPIDAATEPASGPKTANENAPDVPTFTAPASWKRVPAQAPYKVELDVADGQQLARIKLIDFRATEGPMIADPLSNINRWRREVGLEEIQKDALPGATEGIQIDGRPATFAAMIPDAAKTEQSHAAQATLAAIVRDGDRVWFIKMMGSRDLVASRKDEFENFLKSIKFPTTAGAVNGNK